jgi:polyisoprenoid-binding protein YceI
MRGPRQWGWRRWLVGGAVVVVVVLAVGGPFFYIHVIEGPPPKKLSLATTGDTGPTVPVSGTWQVNSSSEVGYRVSEVLFGQSTTAVGRTHDVTGTMTVTPTQVTDASFTAQMNTVTSDQSSRDEQFRGRIMDVSKYPTARFVLASPISLGVLPSGAQLKTYQAKGALTLRGVTKDVTITLSAKRSGSTIALNGDVPVVFADYDIPNPTFGPASVGNKGSLELLLVFSRS